MVIQKTAIITGGTSGIGKVTATEIAREGYKTILIARNERKLETTSKEICIRTRNEDVSYYVADLSEISEIERVAKQILQEHPTIDVLVNNAGALFSKRQQTSDGIELTLATNHINYFLLTNLLLPNIKKAPKARIVCVSSEAQQIIKNIDWEDIQYRHKFKGLWAYSQSKMFNAMFTFELAKRLQGTNITVNCMHPGGVNTGFGSKTKGILGFLIRLIFPFLRTAKKGAETLIWLALSKEVEGISGKYFHDKEPIEPAEPAKNHEAWNRLWRVSEDLVKQSAETIPHPAQ